MPRKGRQVIIARGIARSTISGSRKTTTRESPPPPSLALSFSHFFHFHLRIENTHLEGTRIGIFEPISSFSKEGKIEGRDRSCCTRTHTRGCAKRGSRYMPRPSTYSGGFRFSGRCTRVHPVRYQRGWGRGKDGEGGRARGASRTRDA